MILFLHTMMTQLLYYILKHRFFLFVFVYDIIFSYAPELLKKYRKCVLLLMFRCFRLNQNIKLLEPDQLFRLTQEAVTQAGDTNLSPQQKNNMRVKFEVLSPNPSCPPSLNIRETTVSASLKGQRPLPPRSFY